MLAIGRALMSNPHVLLMDEPSEGLAPQIVAEVMATIRRLKEQGLSILLVEQNAKLAFDVADDIVILNSGRVVVDATAAVLGAGQDGFAPASGHLLMDRCARISRAQPAVHTLRPGDRFAGDVAEGEARADGRAGADRLGADRVAMAMPAQ